MEFRIGDRVKQRNVSGSESPFAVITRISGHVIFHQHENKESENSADTEEFELVSREEVIYFDE
jgi:hypothetical protein